MMKKLVEYARRAYREQTYSRDGEELAEPDNYVAFGIGGKDGPPQLYVELRAGEKRLAVVRFRCEEAEVLNPDDAWVDEDGVFHEFTWELD